MITLDRGSTSSYPLCKITPHVIYPYMLLFISCKIRPMYKFIFYSQLLSIVYDIFPISYRLPRARLNLCINSYIALSYFPMYGISFIILTLSCSLLCKKCVPEDINYLVISTLPCSFKMIVLQITTSVICT
jgi:hypothetical protein